MTADDRDAAAERPAGSPGEGLRLTDAAALTETYRAHQAPLVRYARRFAGSTEAAYDVVQDVFVTLWEQRETLTVRTSLQALLYTMTRNRALNHTRNRARIAADVDAGAAADQSGDASEATPEAALHAAELGRHLRRWIGELPPRRAEAFTLSRFDGLSHAEIAEVMDLSVRTVDTHIVHALRDLRHRLDALLADPTRQPSSDS